MSRWLLSRHAGYGCADASRAAGGGWSRADIDELGLAMKRCVYAGSFDPLTNGHLWMIREGARIFDELIVAIGINPAKKYSYSLEQRLATLKASLADLPSVRVSSFSVHFLADYARTVSARYILRGIRGENDYEYERGMRYVNEDLNPGITTVFLIPPRPLVETSSSMVKGLIGPIGWESAIRKYVPPPVYAMILQHELSRRFLQLWTAVARQAGESLLREITARYGEPHRHYHTAAHIAACLSELDALELAPAARHAIELAIWFHDLVYDVPSNRNEKRSAEYFEGVAQAAGIGPALIKAVVEMILATERHEVPRNQDSEALRLFLDIDLSILGANPERFREYDDGIRREYSSIPEFVYRPKRKRALQRFLQREHIYFTPTFRERYEKQARANIRARVDGD